MIDFPILMSSERYKRLREAGYIGEHGEFTEKLQDALYDTFNAMMDKAKKEREADE
jgi:hypothetical protein